MVNRGKARNPFYPFSFTEDILASMLLQSMVASQAHQGSNNLSSQTLIHDGAVGHASPMPALTVPKVPISSLSETDSSRTALQVRPTPMMIYSREQFASFPVGTTSANHLYFTTQDPRGHLHPSPVQPLASSFTGTIIPNYPFYPAQGSMRNPTGHPYFPPQFSQTAVETIASEDQGSSDINHDVTTHFQSAVPNSQTHMYDISARSFPSSLPVSSTSPYPEFDIQDPMLNIANAPVQSSTTFPPNHNAAPYYHAPMPARQAYGYKNPPWRFDSSRHPSFATRGPILPPMDILMGPPNSSSYGAPTTHPHPVVSNMMAPGTGLPLDLSTGFTSSTTSDQFTRQAPQPSRNAMTMPIRSMTDNRRVRMQYRVRAPTELLARPPRPYAPFCPPPSSNLLAVPSHTSVPSPIMAATQVSKSTTEIVPRHFDSGGFSDLQPQDRVPASLDVAKPPFEDSASMSYYETAIDNVSVTQSTGTSAGSRTRSQDHATTPSTSSSVDKRHPLGISSAEFKGLCEYLQSRDWVRSNEPEPPILEAESLFYKLFTQNRISSRFDICYKPSHSHKCLFYGNGEPCSHKVSDKELAQDHARMHFDYAPFKCSDCGRPDWYVA